eukprot:TRINITY_DN21646_c0_g1_i2.p1 TRINITY_DN21646_c0_g1~~TRINITY_DN21646_c0_g1_i2.p1  ORF type:complete len:362 (+),score=99.37 TRINITY_DN21646_c0_g1_i2:57-1088(+)
MLANGTLVKVHGLVNVQALNDLPGLVTGQRAGQLIVDFGPGANLEGGSRRLLKPENVSPVMPPVGSIVTISGLQQAVTMNGVSGEVLEHKVADGVPKCVLKLPKPHDSPVAVKVANLRVVRGPPEPTPRTAAPAAPPAAPAPAAAPPSAPAPAAAPQPPALPPAVDSSIAVLPAEGRVVQVEGMVDNTALNGQRGPVVGHKVSEHGHSQVVVRLPARMAIRPQNVRLVDEEELFPVGSTVRVKLLEKRVELNGLIGKVLTYRDETVQVGCRSVVIDFTLRRPDIGILALRAVNLEAVTEVVHQDAVPPALSSSDELAAVLGNRLGLRALCAAAAAQPAGDVAS